MKIASNIGPKSSYSCYNMHGSFGRGTKSDCINVGLPYRCIRAALALGAVLCAVLVLGKRPVEAVALMGMVLISNLGMYVLVYACGRVFSHSGRWKGVRALYAAFLLKLPYYFVTVGLLVHWVGLKAPVLMAMVGGVSILPIVITAKTVGIYISKSESQLEP